MQPTLHERPIVNLTFTIGNTTSQNYGYLFTKFEFRGMINGGYIIRAKLADLNYNMINRLIEQGYLSNSRERPVVVHFRILSGTNAQYPSAATRLQSAIVISMNVQAGQSDRADVEFVAIDPPSWYLNIGDASGSSFVGRVDQVIRQVVSRYAPAISAEIGRTIDSEYNRWWMMRMDPKTFLSSLLEWSSSVTVKKTNWIIEVDGYNIAIREQASIKSRSRAYYRYYASTAADTILRAELLADNALSAVQTKLVTSGLSAISGRFLDRTTDSSETSVFVKDGNTSNKQIVKTAGDQSFSAPNDGKPPLSGWSAIQSIPEIYSAGELGVDYANYIDGKPRTIWLGMVNNLLRAKFTVLGHGEWSACDGLGVDTIFVKWTCGNGDSGDKFWWVTGGWLVYGFHHIVTQRQWETNLYCSRFDHDSSARRVGT